MTLRVRPIDCLDLCWAHTNENWESGIGRLGTVDWFLFQIVTELAGSPSVNVRAVDGQCFMVYKSILDHTIEVTEEDRKNYYNGIVDYFTTRWTRENEWVTTTTNQWIAY